jgi:hypothetical protein
VVFLSTSRRHYDPSQIHLQSLLVGTDPRPYPGLPVHGSTSTCLILGPLVQIPLGAMMFVPVPFSFCLCSKQKATERSKEVALDTDKRVFTSCHQNATQNHNGKLGNRTHLQGSDGSVQHSEPLGSWALYIVRNCKY